LTTHLQAYHVPAYFSSDWLNAFLDSQRSAACSSNSNSSRCSSSSAAPATTADYRFVYCGPKHSWTPLHSDVLRSYSWCAEWARRMD